MALDTYDALKLAIQDWSDRDDYSSDNLDEFIDLTETLFKRAPMSARSNALGGIRANKQVATGTLSGDSLALPSDWLEGDYLTLTTTPRYTLAFAPPEQLQDLHRSGNGRPRYWTVEDQIYFDVTPDSAYSYQLGYWPSFTALSASNASNWVLANFPDAYLHGCLMHAAGFTKDDAAIAKHAKGYQDAVVGANMFWRRSRQARGPIASRITSATP